jgi:hypothetical protein
MRAVFGLHLRREAHQLTCRLSNNDPLHFRWSPESVFSTGILTSRHHEPRVLDQFASDFKLDEKQAFLRKEGSCIRFA